MSLEAQAKVLRALQENKISRIGSDTDIQIDVRVIAATNKNLKEEIAKGRFREDLYHRLSVIIIEVPPLKDRPEDIDELVTYFLETICNEMGIAQKNITPEALQALKSYEWTGNIRELRNVVERSLIIADSDTLTPDTLPLNMQNLQATPDNGYSGFDLSGVEKMHIQKVLKYTNGNKTETSRLLGIGLTTLYRKIEEYGL